MSQGKNANVNIIIKAVDKVTGAVGRILAGLRSITTAALRLGQALMSSLGRGFTGILRGIGDQFKMIGSFALAGGLSAGFYKLAEGIIGSTVEMQRFKAQLTGVFDGSSGAAKALKWATDFEKRAPYAINTIIESMARLKAYGVDPMKGSLEVIGNYSAQFGRDLRDGVEATADALMGEWERMKEFGLKREILQKWANSHGFAGIFNNQGQIVDQSKFQLALFTYMQGKAKGAMDRMMNTIEGRWSNLKTKIWTILSSIGSALAPTIQRILNMANILLGQFFNKDRLDGWSKAIQNMFSRDRILAFVTGLANVIVFLKHVGDIAKKVFDLIMTGIANMAKYAVLGAQYAVNAVIGMINGIASGWVKLQVMWERGIDWIATKFLKWGAMRAGDFTSADNYQKMYDANEKDRQKRAAGNYNLYDYVDWSKQAQQAYDFVKTGVIANIAGALSAKAYSKEAQDIVNTVMAAWDKAGQKDKATLTDPLKDIASNTAQLVKQNDEILTKIYGGGPRLQWMARRFAFGMGGMAPGAGSITINLTGGTQRDQDVAAEAITKFFDKALGRTPKVIKKG